MNVINDASGLAKQNSFYVSFKTGGSSSKPYLALRSKKVSKSKLIEEETFRDIAINCREMFFSFLFACRFHVQV